MIVFKKFISLYILAIIQKSIYLSKYVYCLFLYLVPSTKTCTFESQVVQSIYISFSFFDICISYIFLIILFQNDALIRYKQPIIFRKIVGSVNNKECDVLLRIMVPILFFFYRSYKIEGKSTSERKTNEE